MVAEDVQDDKHHHKHSRHLTAVKRFNFCTRSYYCGGQTIFRGLDNSDVVPYHVKTSPKEVVGSRVPSYFLCFVSPL